MSFGAFDEEASCTKVRYRATRAARPYPEYYTHYFYYYAAGNPWHHEQAPFHGGGADPEPARLVHLQHAVETTKVVRSTTR